MKNKKLYYSTVDILVDAYFKGTLKHMECAACAVGNIIAARMGIKILAVPGCVPGDINYVWSKRRPAWFNPLHFPPLPGLDDAREGLRQIKISGYTADELFKIERAFEAAKDKDDNSFKGLMAVIDALDIIHQNTDKTVTESQKSRFACALQ